MSKSETSICECGDAIVALVEALTELCDEIDKHEIHAAISETSISWFKRKARDLLARYGHPVEPEGWQLVPKETTQEMFYTCEHIFDHGNSGESPFEFFDRKYKDILEAAPKFGGGNDGSV